MQIVEFEWLTQHQADLTPEDHEWLEERGVFEIIESGNVDMPVVQFVVIMQEVVEIVGRYMQEEKRKKQTSSSIDQIIRALRTLRVDLVPDEFTLQRAIQTVLDNNHITYRKEYALAPRNRVDFLVDGGFVIEVKCGRQKPNLTRVVAQLRRYAEFDQVTALLLVVDRNLVGVPKELNQKPCYVLGLHQLWGIAL